MDIDYAKKAMRAFGKDLLSSMNDKAVANAIEQEITKNNKCGVIVTCYDPRLNESLGEFVGGWYYENRVAGGVLPPASGAGAADSQSRRSVVLPFKLRGELADTLIIMGHTDCAACGETCMASVNHQHNMHTHWIPDQNTLSAALINGQGLCETVKRSVEEFSVLQSMENALDYKLEDGRSVRELVEAGTLHVIGAMMDVNGKMQHGHYPVTIFDPETQHFVSMREVASMLDSTLAMPQMSLAGTLADTLKTAIASVLSAISGSDAESPPAAKFRK